MDKAKSKDQPRDKLPFPFVLVVLMLGLFLIPIIGTITGKVTEKSIVLDAYTDKEVYLLGELVFIATDPAGANWSIRLTNPNGTTEFLASLIYMPKMVGKYGLNILVDYGGLSERIQRSFEIVELGSANYSSIERATARGVDFVEGVTPSKNKTLTAFDAIGSTAKGKSVQIAPVISDLHGDNILIEIGRASCRERV